MRCGGILGCSVVVSLCAVWWIPCFVVWRPSGWLCGGLLFCWVAASWVLMAFPLVCFCCVAASVFAVWRHPRFAVGRLPWFVAWRHPCWLGGGLLGLLLLCGGILVCCGGIPVLLCGGSIVSLVCVVPSPSLVLLGGGCFVLLVCGAGMVVPPVFTTLRAVAYAGAIVDCWVRHVTRAPQSVVFCFGCATSPGHNNKRGL